ncbi:MAG: aminotransferase class I/II-fold pyridoxal phosphate-dependent enzyme [Rubripirellula sp.]
MTKFAYLSERLNELELRGRLRSLVPREVSGVELTEPHGQRLLNFGGNDYLGLAAQPNQIPSQSDADAALGGSGASALLSGWTTDHELLSKKIASLETTDSAVVYPSGYAACSGTVAILAEDGDCILSDQLNHASLIDGSRLSGADCTVYPHRDWQVVERCLKESRHKYQRAWIISNAVFGMDGHIAPLEQLVRIAERYDAFLIVDEAHGTGVLGDDGSGACAALGVKGEVAVRIGTLSKAVGSQGGFVAGPTVLVDYLINRSRSLIYSTSLSPPAVRAAMEGIDRIVDEPERRARLQSMARHVRDALSIDAGSSLEASVPIIPLVVGRDDRAVELAGQLRKRGFYVPAIRPPTVAEGSARLRISLSAAHDDEMIEALVDAIQAIT